MAQAPMADTDTAGTVECEVHAGASDAEGRGMDASDNFAIFERTIASEPGARGMVVDGTGEAATGGGGSAGARTAATRACVTGDAAVDSSDADGTGMVGDGALAAVVHSMEAKAHGDDAFATPTAGVAPTRRRRSSKQSRAKQDQRKHQRRE